MTLVYLIIVNNCCILGPPEKPMNVAVLEKTENSITVAWKAGLNGGFEQHFKVFYRQKDQMNYQESLNNITSPKTGRSVNYTIDGLQPKKEYEINIVAINKFSGGSQSQAAMVTVTTESKI